MKAMKPLACLGMVIMMSGCADTLLSDSRIQNETAMALGVPGGSVLISGRRYDGGTNTYYTARTPRGMFNCTLNGGTVLSAGIVNTPRCTRA